jgi:hypothetical protein
MWQGHAAVPAVVLELRRASGQGGRVSDPLNRACRVLQLSSAVPKSHAPSCVDKACACLVAALAFRSSYPQGSMLFCSFCTTRLSIRGYNLRCALHSQRFVPAGLQGTCMVLDEMVAAAHLNASKPPYAASIPAASHSDRQCQRETTALTASECHTTDAQFHTVRSCVSLWSRQLAIVSDGMRVQKSIKLG